MAVQADGRHRMTAEQVRQRAWEKLKGWVRDPNDGDYLIPNFKPCSLRVLQQKCLPCGRNSNYAYYCPLKLSIISVAYCEACTDAQTPNEN